MCRRSGSPSAVWWPHARRLSSVEQALNGQSGDQAVAAAAARTRPTISATPSLATSTRSADYVSRAVAPVYVKRALTAAIARAQSTVDELQQALEGQHYVADRGLAISLYLALQLKRPLFLEGEPGVGKTEVAKVLAKVLGTELIRLQCYEGLDVSHAVYEWNYPRQLLEIRLLEASQTLDRTTAASQLFTEPFLIKRPLLRALEGRRRAGAGAPHRRNRSRRRRVRGIPARAAVRFSSDHPRARDHRARTRRRS